MSDALAISVVVPTHARPRSLHRCLEGLDRIAFEAPRPCTGRGFEVIVVVDGDGPTASELAAPPGLDLRLIHRPHGGPAATRNHGAQVARGPWLAFLDDDCVPAPDWLTRLYAALLAHPNALIGGHTINALDRDLYAETTQLMVHELIHWQANDAGHVRFLPSCNLAVARDAFWAVGGFDAAFPLPAGEDRDFCDRWNASGRVSIVVPKAVVDHYHHLSLASFWRQHARYGRGARALRVLRSGRTGADTERESSGLYRRLLTAPFRGRSVGRALSVAARMVLAQAATTYGFLAEAWAARRARSG